MVLPAGFSVSSHTPLLKSSHTLRQLRSKRAVSWAFVFFIVLEIGLFVFVRYCLNDSSVFYQASRAAFQLNTWLCALLLFLCLIQVAVRQSLLHTVERLLLVFSESSLRFKIHFFSALAVLSAAMYLSTGTLSPYAITTVINPPYYPTVEPECHYLFNGDYEHFVALFFLVDGKPKHAWESSIVLRRILYNIIVYPFMKICGHDLGGIISNFFLTVLAFFSFAVFSLRTSGEAGTIAGLWLLALFPEITYYAGQPFLYALIVPGYVWLYMLLWKLDKDMSARSVWIVSIAMGLLFTGYDFMVYFGPAAIIMLMVRKKYLQVPAALFGMLFFIALWWVVLRYCLDSSFSSINSQTYGDILRSYFQPAPLEQWFGLIKKLPERLFANFFFSCFVFLPTLFIIAACLYKRRLTLPETCLLVSVGAVFLFINCSPPRLAEWMSGTWIARLYAPMFVVFLFYLTRVFQEANTSPTRQYRKWFLNGLLVLAVSGNAVVAFGPALNDPAGISSEIYWRFYKHSWSAEPMKINLTEYGRRPWGFCR